MLVALVVKGRLLLDILLVRAVGGRRSVCLLICSDQL